MMARGRRTRKMDSRRLRRRSGGEIQSGTMRERVSGEDARDHGREIGIGRGGTGIGGMIALVRSRGTGDGDRGAEIGREVAMEGDEIASTTTAREIDQAIVDAGGAGVDHGHRTVGPLVAMKDEDSIPCLTTECKRFKCHDLKTC